MSLTMMGDDCYTDDDDDNWWWYFLANLFDLYFNQQTSCMTAFFHYFSRMMKIVRVKAKDLPSVLSLWSTSLLV